VRRGRVFHPVEAINTLEINSENEHDFGPGRGDREEGHPVEKGWTANSSSSNWMKSIRSM